MERPFPPAWDRIIERTVPVVAALPPPERDLLRRLMLAFLAEKRFEGCAGLEVTDEVRLTIAAQACLLLLGREETDVYPGLRTILVYPSRYLAEARQVGPGGVVTEGPQLRLGESWHRPGVAGGPVVLAWDAVRRGAMCPSDGRNVVFHEFAHQLDSESGSVEGAPLLAERSAYAAWARVLGQEFSRLGEDLRLGRDTLLGPYAATSPAEFFAVVTEAFFERPRALAARHPELYQQLQSFYRQDPASWAAACATE